MLELLAAATTAPAESQSYNLVHFWGPLVLFGLMMYFLLLAPKKKQDKQRQNMLNEMKRGDEIQTIGGVIGKVVEAREERVLVKVDESSNTKIWFTRGAIARVIAEDAKDGKTTAASK